MSISRVCCFNNEASKTTQVETSVITGVVQHPRCKIGEVDSSVLILGPCIDVLIAWLWSALRQKIKYQLPSCEDECNPIISTSTSGQRNICIFIYFWQILKKHTNGAQTHTLSKESLEFGAQMLLCVYLSQPITFESFFSSTCSWGSNTTVQTHGHWVIKNEWEEQMRRGKLHNLVVTDAIKIKKFQFLLKDVSKKSGPILWNEGSFESFIYGFLFLM